MYLKNIGILCILLLSATAFAQKKVYKAVVLPFSISFNEEKNVSVFNFQELFKRYPIEYYTEMYTQKITPLLAKALKEVENIKFQVATTTEMTEEERLDEINLYKGVTTEYRGTYMLSNEYKKKKYVKEPDPQYVELVNKFADKYGEDVLVYLVLDGYTKEKKNKNGEYPDNPHSYLICQAFIIDGNNGKIIDTYNISYPKETVGSVLGSNSNTQVTPKADMTDEKIQRYSTKFADKVADLVEKAMKKREKK